jgi:hypothetical protein
LDDAAHGKQETPAAQPGTGAKERQTPGPEPLYEPHQQPHYEPAVAERQREQPWRPEQEPLDVHPRPESPRLEPATAAAHTVVGQAEPLREEITQDDPTRPVRKGWWQRKFSGE